MKHGILLNGTSKVKSDTHAVCHDVTDQRPRNSLLIIADRVAGNDLGCSEDKIGAKRAMRIAAGNACDQYDC
jgi:hypothetical protein